MRRKVGRKWTQSDLGIAVGVSPQQISRYESEEDEPKWEMWKKMAKALRYANPGELAFGEARVEIPLEPEQPVPVELRKPATKRRRQNG